MTEMGRGHDFMPSMSKSLQDNFVICQLALLGVKGSVDQQGCEIEICFYLQNFKVYDFQKCIAEHCVGSKFSTVTHRVKVSISTPHNVLHGFQFGQKISLVPFPVIDDNGKQKVPLMEEKGPCRIS